MPSKLTSTSCRSWISATIGWVDESWSWRYAQSFSWVPKVVQASVQWVAADWQVVEAHSAKDTLSHRSFHQRIVTRLPNHMWASSCSTVRARRSTMDSVTLDRKTYISLIVTQPAFSIAPMLYSGVKSWSYFSKGYAQSNSSSKNAKPRLVRSNRLSASR